MQINTNKFNITKHNAKSYYENIRNLKCPYLQEEVNFNSKGFNHLLSKSWNRGRSNLEQYTRLKLLPKVVEIIKRSHTLQEYDQRKIFVRRKTNSSWNKVLKNVEYFVFVAILKDYDLRLKVVVKKIEDGQPFFWSVYPSWKISTDGNRNKKFYSINPEEY